MVADFAAVGAGSDVAVAAAVNDAVGLVVRAAEVVVEADKRRVVSIALYQAGCTAIVYPGGHGTRRTSCGTPAMYSGLV